jgi:hypothetical protein
VINTCNSRIAALVDVDPDQVLAALGAEMSELWRVRIAEAVAALNGATTPDEAHIKGVSDEWNALRPLADADDQLRDAQAFVMGDEMHRHQSDYFYEAPLASRLCIRNIDDIFPAWNDGGSAITLSGTPQDPRPWPSDRIARLVWLSTSAAEVWLPTFAQIEQLQRELHRKFNPEPEPEVTQRRPDKPMQQFGAVHRRPKARA